MDPETTQKEIISEFRNLDTWEDRYQKIIAMGKQLDSLPEEDKSDDLLVKGCQSKVWLKANLLDDGRVEFKADSDAVIVKGLIALLLKVYSGRKPSEILTISPKFIEAIGLNTNLSQTRSNGLVAMIKQIKFYGLAFQAQQSAQN